MTISPSSRVKPLKRILSTALLGGLALYVATDQTRADSAKPKTLVELYTSQGCNSCPPANALLKKYIDRSDVIALSLPVDYWDYLGWKDTFGKSQFSNRQRRYALARRDGQVYTPQIVANGVTHAVGSRRYDVDNAINGSLPPIANKRIPLKIERDGKTLKITSPAPTPGTLKSNPTIWLALTTRKASVSVPRGENRGKVVTYYNVVRDLKAVGTWNGTPLTIKIPDNHDMKSPSSGCVVFLQDGRAGPILGAAEL